MQPWLCPCSLRLRTGSNSAQPARKRFEADVSSRELLQTTEWLSSEEQDEETLTKDSVKRLEHWAYDKKLHQQNDTEYRQLLRARISKQIASTGDELLNSERMKSTIIGTITQQLAAQKDIDQMRQRAVLVSDLAALGAVSGLGEGVLQTIQRVQSDAAHKSTKDAESLRKIDGELAMELQTLRMRKELMDRKTEQKRLLEENSRLVAQIDEEKFSMDIVVKRRNSSQRNDALNLSTNRSNKSSRANGWRSKRHATLQHTGSSMVQEMHARRMEILKEKEKVQARIESSEKNVEKYKGEYEDNLRRIHGLEYEMSQIKPEIDANIKKQVSYYYTLLEEGKDTRNNGLSWIIKSLWYLEHKFPTQARFPSYLEEETSVCILKAAALEIRKDKAESELKGLAAVNRRTSLARLQAYNPLPELDAKNDGDSAGVPGMRRMKMPIPKAPTGNKGPRQLRDAKEVQCEEKVAKIALQVRELKRGEINRVAKTYVKWSLQGKRPSAHISEVLCALVGKVRR